MINRIDQLEQQYQSAAIVRDGLEKAAATNPDPGIVSALLEARAAYDACQAEYQKALFMEVSACLSITLH